MEAGELSGCNQVIDEVMSALRRQSMPVLSAATYRHIGTCSRCRAGLLLLLGAFDSESNHRATDQSCGSCQADLAAFIDLEAQDPVEAATIYPHVWWHLWTCETCSQTYEFTHTFLNAQRSGELTPLQLPGLVAPRAVPLVRQVRLNRQLLAFALPSPTLSAPALRGPDDRYVLFDEIEDEPEHRQFSITAEEQGEGFWRVFVTVVPPPDGLLLLTFGTLRFVTPFNPDGTAIIDNIPADVLLSPSGPDMEIGIAPTNE